IAGNCRAGSLSAAFALLNPPVARIKPSSIPEQYFSGISHCDIRATKSLGHNVEIGAFAGFVAKTLIRDDERGAGDDHLRNRVAHLGWNLDAGEHLRRCLRRWCIACPLFLDLAPPHAAVPVAALFDIADML